MQSRVSPYARLIEARCVEMASVVYPPVTVASGATIAGKDLFAVERDGVQAVSRLTSKFFQGSVEICPDEFRETSTVSVLCVY